MKESEKTKKKLNKNDDFRSNKVFNKINLVFLVEQKDQQSQII